MLSADPSEDGGGVARMGRPRPRPASGADSSGPIRAVGQGLQPAKPIAAKPVMDRLAADPIALGHLDHREPVAQDFHDGVEAVLPL